MKLVFLGPPGAGKGTQAQILSKKLGIPTIATGDILRFAIKEGTPVGAQSMEHMAAGGLVPDDIIIDIVRDRVSMPDCSNGFILDGAPRTIIQADALVEHGIDIDAVVSIEIPDAVVQSRLEGRRTCPQCGATYHIESNPPRRAGICNTCNTYLIIRSDDFPETVRNRLATFHRQIEPLKGYYKEKGLLRTVQAGLSIAETTSEIYKMLGVEQ